MAYRMVLAALLLPVALPAQWRVTLSSSMSAVRGDSRNPLDPEHPELRGDRPTSFSAGLSRGAAAWRVGVELRRTSADLTEVSDGSAVVAPDAMHAWGVSFETGRRIAGHPEGTTLYGLVAAGFDRWTFDLDQGNPRTRPSAQAALESDFPIGGRWSALVRGEVAVGPSVFTDDELPEDFSRATRWRSGVALGIAMRP